MKLDYTVSGVFPIAVIPFKPNGEIDFASIDRMTDFYISAGPQA